MERMQAADIAGDVTSSGGRARCKRPARSARSAGSQRWASSSFHSSRAPGCARPSRDRPHVSHAHVRADLPSRRRWLPLARSPPLRIHRRHRAGVVPAFAPVLLVRRISGVLAAVVAAELLALRGLAPAPPCVGRSRRPPTPVRFAEDRPSSHRARSLPLARRVNPARTS
jgi:hypothetical protein